MIVYENFPSYPLFAMAKDIIEQTKTDTSDRDRVEVNDMQIRATLNAYSKAQISIKTHQCQWTATFTLSESSVLQ